MLNHIFVFHCDNRYENTKNKKKKERKKETSSLHYIHGCETEIHRTNFLK